MTSVDFGPTAQRLGELVARVDDSELGKPTPCPAYSLGDLIDHIGGLAVAFTSAARKETGTNASQPPPGDAARLTDDWRARIPRDLATLAKAWQEPGAWTGTALIAGDDTPSEIVGLAAVDELVVHGWDLTRATGQPYGPEPEMVTAAQSFLSYFASPDAPAGPEVAFGPSRELPGEAPMLERVVALAGRDPGWSTA